MTLVRRWKLEDLGSQNGVFVNDQKVTDACLKVMRHPLQLNSCSFRPGSEIASQQEALPRAKRAASERDPDVQNIGKLTSNIINEFGRVIVGKTVAGELLIAIAAGSIA